MKHIKSQYHFIHDMVEDGKVHLEKMDTMENFTDALKNSVSEQF